MLPENLFNGFENTVSDLSELSRAMNVMDDLDRMQRHHLDSDIICEAKRLATCTKQIGCTSSSTLEREKHHITHTRWMFGVRVSIFASTHDTQLKPRHNAEKDHLKAISSRLLMEERGISIKLFTSGSVKILTHASILQRSRDIGGRVFV